MDNTDNSKNTVSERSEPTERDRHRKHRQRGRGNNRHRDDHSEQRKESTDQRREQSSDTRPRQQSSPDSRQQSRQAPLISVVIPLKDEAESLAELGERLERVLNQMTRGSYEVIFIDDGSTDTSYEELRNLNRRNNRMRAIRFRTNYGKSAALNVGFKQARGKYVFTMDADLQDDPNELPAMFDLLKNGYDLVSGWKKTRHDPWHKTVPSKFFNMTVRMVTGLKIHDFNCGLKGYRREVLEFLNVYGEMHRYLPAQAHWQGFRVTELPVQHHKRKHGVSKFGISRFVKGYLDLLTLVLTNKYAQRPLHIFGTVGTIIATIGFVVDLYLTIEWFRGETFLTNRPLALLGVLLIIVGVQLISIGLLGEMIVKNSINNATYSIRETL